MRKKEIVRFGRYSALQYELLFKKELDQYRTKEFFSTPPSPPLSIAILDRDFHEKRIGSEKRERERERRGE